jgi:hypothetical protein
LELLKSEELAKLAELITFEILDLGKEVVLAIIKGLLNYSFLKR